MSVSRHRLSDPLWPVDSPVLNRRLCGQPIPSSQTRRDRQTAKLAFPTALGVSRPPFSDPLRPRPLGGWWMLLRWRQPIPVLGPAAT